MKTSIISKLVFLIILLLLFFTINKYLFKKDIRDKRGSVNYIINFDSEAIERSEKTYAIVEGLDLIGDLNEISKNISFQLDFVNEESVFYLNNITKNRMSELAIVLSGGKGVFYNKHSSRVRQVKAFEKHYLINYNFIKDSDWEIKDREKIIQGYKCKKAILKNLNGNYEGITAWYSPDLPFKFGPRGIGNLPGLILELAITNRVKIIFTASDVSLNSTNKSFIKPTKGISITKKEFDIIKEKKLLELKE